MNGAELPLRDIHLPPAPGWWPPAPGWWALALIVVAAIAIFFWWARRRRRLTAAVAARREVARLREAAPGLEPARLARDISALLRRAAISFYPRAQAAAITGENWLRFLDEALPEQAFSRGAGRLIAELPYRATVSREEVVPLLDLSARWIDAAARAAGARR